MGECCNILAVLCNAGLLLNNDLTNEYILNKLSRLVYSRRSYFYTRPIN